VHGPILETGLTIYESCPQTGHLLRFKLRTINVISSSCRQNKVKCHLREKKDSQFLRYRVKVRAVTFRPYDAASYNENSRSRSKHS